MVGIAAKSPSGHRLLPRPATTTSPSGHTAAVAAFATAVTPESPWLGTALIPLATAAVLRTRHATRSPGDVLAGAALGAGVAAATCRWWPVHVDEPADTARPNVSVSALPAGLGLITVVNSDAGDDTPAEAEVRILLPMADIRLCASGVDLGRVTSADGTGTYFLNTFSMGGYPELVRAREARERRLGKWPALCVGLLRVLADGPPRTVVIDGRRRQLWLLFAGSHPFARTRLVAAFLTGTLARSRVYRATMVTRLRTDGMGDDEDYTRDGEVSPAADTLHLDKATHALTVHLPPPR